jgi:hypothetical protein
MYIQYIQGLFQSRLGTGDYALHTSSLHYNYSLVTWTDIHMTAAKFKPLTFSVLGFALSSVANICIFMILDDFCLLCYVMVNVRNLESLMHIADRCGSWETDRFRVILRPTVSRPVCLVVWAPFEADDQILNFFECNYFLSSSCRAPSLTRGRVCNLQCNHSLVRVGQEP